MLRSIIRGLVDEVLKVFNEYSIDCGEELSDVLYSALDTRITLADTVLDGQELSLKSDGGVESSVDGFKVLVYQYDDGHKLRGNSVGGKWGYSLVNGRGSSIVGFCSVDSMEVFDTRGELVDWLVDIRQKFYSVGIYEDDDSIEGLSLIVEPVNAVADDLVSLDVMGSSDLDFSPLVDAIKEGKIKLPSNEEFKAWVNSDPWSSKPVSDSSPYKVKQFIIIKSGDEVGWNYRVRGGDGSSELFRDVFSTRDDVISAIQRRFDYAEGVTCICEWDDKKQVYIDVVGDSVSVGMFKVESKASIDDLLAEARNIVSGERREAYGHPKDNFSDIARVWSVLFGKDITAQQVALAMIFLKGLRENHSHDWDNWVDIIGYVLCDALIRGAKE